MSTPDIVLLLGALVCCIAIVARAGEPRVWALVAGLLIVAVLLGWGPLA